MSILKRVASKSKTSSSSSSSSSSNDEEIGALDEFDEYADEDISLAENILFVLDGKLSSNEPLTGSRRFFNRGNSLSIADTELAMVGDIDVR